MIKKITCKKILYPEMNWLSLTLYLAIDLIRYWSARLVQFLLNMVFLSLTSCKYAVLILTPMVGHNILPITIRIILATNISSASSNPLSYSSKPNNKSLQLSSTFLVRYIFVHFSDNILTSIINSHNLLKDFRCNSKTLLIQCKCATAWVN